MDPVVADVKKEEVIPNREPHIPEGNGEQDNSFDKPRFMGGRGRGGWRGPGRGGPMRGGGGPGRFGRGGGGYGGGGDDQGGFRGPGKSQEMRIKERLQQISGPTTELPPIDQADKKFTGRCRLYVGNLTPDTTEEELNEMFKSYGETNEVFINKEKMFAFIRLDFRNNAEKARRELDGSLRKGRTLRVRFAPHTSAVRIKNLPPWSTNELLHHAFGVFGDIERATVAVDDRGKPTNDGIVEFVRRPSALQTIKFCQEGCFFLTASLRPVIAEPLENLPDEDGLPEKTLSKRNPDYMQARDVGPRFAAPGSFEFEYGERWKQLHEMKKQKEDALQREMMLETEKLEAQMEFARHEHETEMLRAELREREMSRERHARIWEEKQREHEEQVKREQDLWKRQQEQNEGRTRNQDQELRRRMHDNSVFEQEQEGRQRPADNPLFEQAQELSNLLDEHEAELRGGAGGVVGGGGAQAYGDRSPTGGNADAKWNMAATEGGYDNRRQQGGDMHGGMRGGMGGGRGMGGGNRGGNQGYWGQQQQQYDRGGEDEYGQNKRRRY